MLVCWHKGLTKKVYLSRVAGKAIIIVGVWCRPLSMGVVVFMLVCVCVGSEVCEERK